VEASQHPCISLLENFDETKAAYVGGWKAWHKTIRSGSAPGATTVAVSPQRGGAANARIETLGRTVSGLISLAHHPGPDVRGTIAEDNASAGFVLSQKVNGVTIRED
jgi:hypothetical protein